MYEYWIYIELWILEILDFYAIRINAESKIQISIPNLMKIMHFFNIPFLSMQ